MAATDALSDLQSGFAAMQRGGRFFFISDFTEKGKGLGAEESVPMSLYTFVGVFV